MEEGRASHIQVAEDFVMGVMARLMRKDVLFWLTWTPIDRVKKRVAGSGIGKREANTQEFHIGGPAAFFIF
jgi:hypothetical protein